MSASDPEVEFGRTAGGGGAAALREEAWDNPAARRLRRRRADPRRRQARPDPRRRQRHPLVRWHPGRVRRPPRGAAWRDHGADRSQRRRQDDVLQPPHRLRQARHRAPWSSTGRRPAARPSYTLAVEGHGPHVPADQGAGQDVGARQHDAGRPGADGRVDVPWARAQVDGPGAPACGTAPSRCSSASTWST